MKAETKQKIAAILLSPFIIIGYLLQPSKHKNKIFKKHAIDIIKRMNDIGMLKEDENCNPVSYVVDKNDFETSIYYRSKIFSDLIESNISSSFAKRILETNEDFIVHCETANDDNSKMIITIAKYLCFSIGINDTGERRLVTNQVDYDAVKFPHTAA